MQVKAFETNPQWAGCYCQFYLNSDKENQTKHLNRDRACTRIINRTMNGYLAFVDDQIIGWVSANAAKNYRQLPSSDETTSRILCFVIEKSSQGKGIATALLNFAIADLTKQGFKHIEAAPLITDEHQPDAYRGKLSMFLKAGFKEITMIDDEHVLVHRKL